MKEERDLLSSKLGTTLSWQGYSQLGLAKGTGEEEGVEPVQTLMTGLLPTKSSLLSLAAVRPVCTKSQIYIL